MHVILFGSLSLRSGRFPSLAILSSRIFVPFTVAGSFRSVTFPADNLKLHPQPESAQEKNPDLSTGRAVCGGKDGGQTKTAPSAKHESRYDCPASEGEEERGSLVK